MRDECTLGSNDELFLTREESITPYCTTSLLVSDIFFSCQFMHDLFEIESSSIEEKLDDTRWYFQMSGISPISISILIFDIDNSYIPIFLSFGILIYSPLHTDKVVCIWFFSSSVDGSIFCSCTEFLECGRHIRDSWLDSMVRKCCPTRIWRGREDMLDGSRFWLIGRTDGEVHRLFINNSLYIL